MKLAKPSIAIFIETTHPVKNKRRREPSTRDPGVEKDPFNGHGGEYFVEGKTNGD